jgi:hypothetical protein
VCTNNIRPCGETGSLDPDLHEFHQHFLLPK